ncbi:MAG: VirB4 family type IV secretion system protein, partial [Bacillota bacterium]
NKSIQEYSSRLVAGGQALALSRWQQSLEDAKLLLKKVDQEAQKVYRVAVILLVLAPDEEELNRRSRQVEAACTSAGMRVRTAVYRQEDTLKAAGPWGLLPPEVEALAGREMPAETIAAAYPWVAGGLNHGRGVVWARDADGGLILVDRWQPPEGSGITNPNVNILGTSGGGKSYASKVLLLREYALGARILVLDPEREYRWICRDLGGAWINAAGGSGRINPLQVRPLADQAGDQEQEEQDPDQDRGLTVRGPLADHLQRVKTFFQIYLPGLDDLERARLDEAILDAYSEYGVDWHTQPEKVDTWPTVADVYRHVKTIGAERLAALLRGAAEGADSALWAGQTTSPPAGDFTVLDIRDLTDASDTVRRAPDLGACPRAKLVLLDADLVVVILPQVHRLQRAATWLQAGELQPEELHGLRYVIMGETQVAGKTAGIWKEVWSKLMPGLESPVAVLLPVEGAVQEWPPVCRKGNERLDRAYGELLAEILPEFPGKTRWSWFSFGRKKAWESGEK